MLGVAFLVAFAGYSVAYYGVVLLTSKTVDGGLLTLTVPGRYAPNKVHHDSPTGLSTQQAASNVAGDIKGIGGIGSGIAPSVGAVGGSQAPGAPLNPFAPPGPSNLPNPIFPPGGSPGPHG